MADVKYDKRTSSIQSTPSKQCGYEKSFLFHPFPVAPRPDPEHPFCRYTGIGLPAARLLPFNLLLLKSFIDSLCLMGLGVVLSAVLLSSYLIFGKEQRVEMLAMLPMAVFVGLLVYVIYLQVIDERAKTIENEIVTEEMEEAEEGPKGVIDGIEESTRGKGAVKDEEPLERIAVKSGQKIHVIYVPDIVYIQSDGDYVQIITSGNKYLKEDTMKYFEANLPTARFVRVHRSYIVNVEKILRIETYEKQNQMLTLANGDKIRASVSGYKALRAVLNL